MTAYELRSAAKVLREMAAAATPGPWTVTKNINRNTKSHMQSTWKRPGLPDQVINPHRHNDFAWIALLGPDKAELIATWLETEAACIGDVQEIGDAAARLVDTVAGDSEKTTFHVVLDTSGPAVAFARAILKEAIA